MKTHMQQYLELREKTHHGRSYVKDNGTIYVGVQDLSAEEAEALGKWLIDTCSAKYEVVLKKNADQPTLECCADIDEKWGVQEPNFKFGVGAKFLTAAGNIMVYEEENKDGWIFLNGCLNGETVPLSWVYDHKGFLMGSGGPDGFNYQDRLVSQTEFPKEQKRV